VRQYFVTKDTPVPDGVVPVGQAVEDMEILLLDDAGRPVDGDVVGEIAVRSRFLAPGYWRRPDLTAAAFLADPAGGDTRIYRTGDLGRLSGGAGGCLEHLGRKDFQLRIRGQWVNVVAIEGALRELGGCQEVLVRAVEDRASEPRLVAYLVPAAGPPPKVDELRRRLARRLPAHMIPAAFLVLDALPLTAHGKVDLRALPVPGRARPDLGQPFVAPGNPLQRQLKQIWEQVLSVAPVGIRDGFFDLGGDSLDAAVMLQHVEHATGRPLAPDILLSGPTIEHLARHLSERAGELADPIVEIQQGSNGAPLYFLHGEYLSGGYYCLELARRLGDRPFYALPPCGVNGFPVPGTYAAMARAHVAILRQRQPAGPYLLAGTCNGGLVAYEMARQLVAEGERVAGLILIAASAANLRFKLLRHVVAPITVFSRRAALRAFVRLQPFWTGLTALPLTRRPGFLLRKLPRAPDLLRALTRGGREAIRAPGSAADAPRIAPESPTLLRETYLRIDKEYVPGPYPGPVTLFWWEGEGEGPEAEARWWRRLVREVALHRFPGAKHVDALTGDIAPVAERLRVCCAEADRVLTALSSLPRHNAFPSPLEGP
jgi:thioesterase domain-containing protein